MTDKTENNCSGDPCMWICFPCVFTIVICEKIIQSCFMCICCITPNIQEPIHIEQHI